MCLETYNTHLILNVKTRKTDVKQNMTQINQLKSMEEAILDKVFINNKKPVFRLYEQLNSGNLKLFKDITKSGLLISEVMPNVESKPYRFLIRNRLIAALSRSTVVVEAKFISGSIRTARDAAEIFRPVFAIPGPVTSPLSEGCHRLIAERVADIATSLDEILEVITPLQMR